MTEPMSDDVSLDCCDYPEPLDDRSNERLQRLKHQLRDIQRTTTYQENGSFITINRSDFVELTNKACADTMNAHGDQVDERWMKSFRKRFWGSLKNLDNNRHQTT